MDGVVFPAMALSSRSPILFIDEGRAAVLAAVTAPEMLDKARGRRTAEFWEGKNRKARACKKKKPPGRGAGTRQIPRGPSGAGWGPRNVGLSQGSCSSSWGRFPRRPAGQGFSCPKTDCSDLDGDGQPALAPFTLDLKGPGKGGGPRAAWFGRRGARTARRRVADPPAASVGGRALEL